MALTGLAIGAALGLVKNQIEQQAAAKKRQYEASVAAYSPWTGLKSEYVQDPNLAANVLLGGGSGAAMGSNIAKDSAETDLMKSLASNPTVSGSTAGSLGGLDMSSKLSDKASDFSKSVPSAWTGVDKKAEDPAWFYGNSPSKFSQPSQGSGLGPNPNDRAVKYKSILDAGLSPENPEDYWKINPFKTY